jgi:DNA-directed RNA polymerase specialized sigma24 family protein
MPRRPTGTADPPQSTFHELAMEIALAERYALLQRVLIYPASLRREVIRQSLHGVRDAQIAHRLSIPLADMRAIMEAFSEFADDQSI